MSAPTTHNAAPTGQGRGARRSARVVLVNWKNAPLTLRAARSIAPQLRARDTLILVDNGSGDDSLDV
ncbi:MAG: glycosyltransferase family 2 protein, partial [Pauljensenia sp.]